MAVAKITSRCPQIKIASFHLFSKQKKNLHIQKNHLQLTEICQMQTKHWDAFFFFKRNKQI